MITRLEVCEEQERQLQMEPGVLHYEAVAKETLELARAVNDHYRCPENFFDFALGKPLSSSSGYFRLGQDTICYGRSCSGALASRPESTQHNVIEDLSVKGGKLHLSFDPTEIIDNLRLERYASTWQTGRIPKRFLRRLYCSVRPIMNLSVRRRIQRFYSRNWEKQSFPKWPVDTTVEDICETLLLISMDVKCLDSVPFVWFWPGGAKGCMVMTHDVETTAGRDYCAELMKVDDSFGIKAAFGIIPEGRYDASPGFLQSMRDRGFEVVVQDLNHDGRLFDNKEEFLRRAKIINHYGFNYGAKGFRAGVLYRNPEWYDALEFAYDMSIPNVAHLDPQHGGCCTVMPYFIGDILEIPVTTIQDYMLFYILDKRSIDLWKDQIELVLGKNGLASFIVHPDYLLQKETISLYEELLGYLRELKARRSIWFALPSEIDSWWIARSRMTVVGDEDSWRIEGDATGRARLAYARCVEGKLVYELAPAPQNEELRTRAG